MDHIEEGEKAIQLKLKTVYFARITETAKEPVRDEDSIGYDIFADEDVELLGLIDLLRLINHNDMFPSNSFSLDKHSNIKKIRTGIVLECPLEYGEFIADRSSMAGKGITFLGGVIEGSYRGEVLIVLANLGVNTYQIKKGDKIAQLIFKAVELPVLKEKRIDQLTETKRGNQGFGEKTGQ